MSTFLSKKSLANLIRGFISVFFFGKITRLLGGLIGVYQVFIRCLSNVYQMFIKCLSENKYFYVLTDSVFCAMLALGNAMENDTVDYRLTQIEKKLDTFEKKIDNLICLQVKTTEQEGRLKRCEIDIANIQRKQEKNLDRWISPFLSAIISGVVAFIFLKVGLK